jgi:N-acetylglutamate synthase-like GNAT family acetyltransferase
MQLRSATIDDASALADLITQLGYATTADQMRDRLAPLLSDPIYGTLVAEVDRRVVGMVGLRMDRGHEYDGVQGRIVALVVHESVRGKGIGGSLVEAGELWARERGAHKIMVNTANHRTRTHEFYRALGYEMTGLRFVKPL